jgi:hypothetical protein
MKPSKDATAVVDLVDVLLADGAVLAADVVITVADVPLVGVQARVLLAGMTRLSEEGIFDTWDEEIRERGRATADDTTRNDA